MVRLNNSCTTELKYHRLALLHNNRHSSIFDQSPFSVISQTVSFNISQTLLPHPVNTRWTLVSSWIARDLSAPQTFRSLRVSSAPWSTGFKSLHTEPVLVLSLTSRAHIWQLNSLMSTHRLLLP